MHETLDSDGLKLASHLARPPGFARVPGLVLCHGFPTGPRGGDSSASTYPDVGGVWLAGSSTGGSLSILVAADNERVRGVATLAAPASFAEWALHPDRLLADARAMGIIRHANFPPDPQAWGRRFAELSPLEAATRIAPRPLLVGHGQNDEVVPLADARAL